MVQAARLAVLLVEDNPADARLARELLVEATDGDVDIVHCESLAAGLECLGSRAIDVALLDLSLSDAHGLDTVARMHARFPLVPIIVLSGLNDEATAVEALQNGAQDYLVKGQGDGHLILRATRYAIERKRVQLQLVAEKEKAELANRAKSDFIANMSHELRTPLNAIIGFSQLMASEAFGPAGHPNYKAYSQDIQDSGTHLLAVINDILDLSKIEAGKAELRDEPIDPGDAIRRCLRVMAERAGAAGLTLVERLDVALPPLRADERMFKQIVLNLLSNAVKFTPAGGHVEVIAGFGDDGSLVVEVKDTGIGIAPGDIAKAMIPFVQIDSALNRKYPGTGLGLSLAKSLVELHGGSFELVSEVAVGTSAIVRLPAARLGGAEQVGRTMVQATRP
jgi:signal transduction histidine kinase